MDLAERAIALIKSGKATRDDQLARLLDTDTAAIAGAMRPLCASGALVTCRIDRVGSTSVNEYRISAAGPRKAGDAHLRKPPTPPEEVLAAAKAATVRTPHRSAPTQHRTEGATMSTLKKRILDAFAKHGPMTTRQLGTHIPDKARSMAAAQLAVSGDLIKLGGGACSTIYGLPGQKPPKGDGAGATSPAKPRKAAKTAAKKRSAPVRKVSAAKAATSAKLRTKHADLRIPHAAPGKARAELLAIHHAVMNPQDAVIRDGDTLTVKAVKEFVGAALAAHAAPSGFRTAIASDGAMLFLGAAAGPFELNRAESRALIDFVRTLDAGAAAA